MQIFGTELLLTWRSTYAKVFVKHLKRATDLIVEQTPMIVDLCMRESTPSARAAKFNENFGLVLAKVEAGDPIPELKAPTQGKAAPPSDQKILVQQGLPATEARWALLRNPKIKVMEDLRSLEVIPNARSVHEKLVALSKEWGSMREPTRGSYR